MTSEFAVAVHAIVYLCCKEAVLSSKALAENICTNPARVRMVMSKLKKSGLVKAREGKSGGGYYVTADASDMTLCQVFRAVGDRVVAGGWRSGDPGTDCLISSGMANILDGIYDELDRTCKEKLDAITIGQLCDQMLPHGA